MSSVYSSYIKRMRMCANENCKGCTYQYEGLTNTEECKHCHDNVCVHECGKDYFCADGKRKVDADVERREE